jgi:restriction system protein
MSSVETTTRTAVDSEGNEYDIEVPATNVVKNALCNFEYPPGGIRIKDVADALTGEFDLNDEQVNARHRAGYNIFLNHVNTAANALVNSEKLLKIRRGWIINPDQPEDITPDDMSSSGEDTPSPEVVMERSYQEIQNNLEAELLQKIKDNPPEFFEQLVLDLLVEMGYGGSQADAEAVGRIGDGGIDGIIKEDPLGLDIVYVQAKRWENNVPEKEIRDFTGALASKGARKGIFITTSGFAKPAIKFAKDMTTKKVILIDGDQLVQLMIKYNVGVSEGNTYQTKQVDSEYFGEVEE